MAKITNTRKRTYKHWTDKDDNFLLNNFEKKKYSELAKKLDRTEVSVRSRLSVALGVTKRDDWSAEDDKKLAKYVKDGLSYAVIAVKMDRTIHAIRQHALIIGLQRNTKWMDDKKAEQLRKDFKKYSNAELATRLGVPVYIIKTNLHHYGLRRDGMNVTSPTVNKSVLRKRMAKKN